MPAETLEAPASTTPSAPASTGATESFSSSTPEIKVNTPTVDKGPQSSPPKPGSAKERMFKDLQKVARQEEPDKTDVAPAAGDRPGADETETPPAAPREQADTTQPVTDKGGDKKKVSPWKLVDEHKAARLKAETELAELRKTVQDPAKYKELETKAEAAERRAKELDEEIKYVNYAKSAEFQEKYQKPYEQAWQRWMGDLGELTVAGSDGTERPIAANDLLELVNMPLQKAREAAENTFGAFADDVMSARKEIRSLFDQQQRALEEAKKMGGQRQEQQQKQWQASQEALRKEITDHWTKANQEAITDEKIAHYFKPVEGDEEGNKRLSKGYELADKAFSVNPLDPRLTPEQRSEIVRLHAAVRNRAAAFGRLSFQNSKLEAKVKSLMEEIGKYRDSDSGGGEPRHEQTTGSHSAKDDVFGALRKLAH
jgi:hypothetical protein